MTLCSLHRLLKETAASIFRFDWHFMLENFVSAFQLSLKPDNSCRHFAWMPMWISGCTLVSDYWHEKCFLQIFKGVMRVAVCFHCCFATSVWRNKMKWVHEPEYQFYVFPFIYDVMPCSPVNRFLLFQGACLSNYPLSHPRNLQVLLFTTVTTSDLLHMNVCTFSMHIFDVSDTVPALLKTPYIWLVLLLNCICKREC